MELWSFSFNREICIDALFVERLAKKKTEIYVLIHFHNLLISGLMDW